MTTISPLWSARSPFLPPVPMSQARIDWLHRALPLSTRSAIDHDEAAGISGLDTADARATPFVRLLIEAGASDAEVHAWLHAMPRSYGQRLHRHDGIKAVARLCDSARKTRPGTTIQIASVEPQDSSRWWTFNCIVIDGEQAGQAFTQPITIRPVGTRPGEPWWRTHRFSWWMVWEACGLPVEPHWPQPQASDLQLLVGRQARVRLDLEADLPIDHWFPRPIELPDPAPPVDYGVVPQGEALDWHPAFDVAFDQMKRAGMRVNIDIWATRHEEFREVLKGEIAARDAGEVVMSRRESPEDLLDHLDRLDRELHDRLATSPDGRVRADWHLQAWPGRLTTFGLPLQSVPRFMRPAFVPVEGNMFVIADWSACQPHIVAALSGDMELRGVLQDPARDLYIEMAHLAWPDRHPASDDRNAGKGVTLPLLYMSGASTLAQRAAQAGRPIPRGDVEDWFSHVRLAFSRRFPQLWQWRLDRKDEVEDHRKRGQAMRWRSPLGRLVVVPPARLMAHKVIPGKAQAIEADALALVLMWSEARMAGTGAVAVFSHHDSVIWEVREEYANKVAQRAAPLMQEAMAQVLGGTISVPSKVHVVREWPDPDASL